MIEEILASLENKRNVLINGPGGCGKTYAIKKIAEELISRGFKVSLTSTTGISAITLNIPEKSIIARTLHSFLGIGLGRDVSKKLYSIVLKNAKAVKRIQKTEILIVDEISMLGGELFEKIDYVCRYIRSNPEIPMGGLTILASGDFLQLGPIKDCFAFESFAWKELNFKPYIFDQPKRYDDTEYFELLLRVRIGEHTPDDVKKLRSRVKAYQLLQAELDQNDPKEVIKPTILHPKKVEVDEVNNTELDKLEGSLHYFIAKDDFEPYNDKARYDVYIQHLEDSIPKSIPLKIGAQVMLKKNLDVEGGLVNGSRGVVLDIIPNMSAKVYFLNGRTVNIPTEIWELKDKNARATRTQLPLILAWSYTIHKSQGSTLDYCVCNIGTSIFSEGQAYVALSRVRNIKGLFLTEFYPPSIKTNLKAAKFTKELSTKEDD